MATAEFQGAVQQSAYAEVESLFEDIVNSTEQGKRGVQHLLEEVSGKSSAVIDPDHVVESMIAELEAQLTVQLREITCLPEYQSLYGTWKGIESMVDRSENGACKVFVLPMTKGELLKEAQLKDFRKGNLYQRLAREEYLQAGGEPYNLITLGFELSPSEGDVKIMRHVAEIAKEAHIAVVGGTSPEFFGTPRWKDIPHDPDVIDRLFDGPTYAKWRSFRESDLANYVGLVLPEVLLRPSYSPDNPIEGLEFFDENLPADMLPWGSGVYAYAGNVVASLAEIGWPSRMIGPQTGGKVNLPMLDGTGSPGVALLIDDILEWCLSRKHGFLPLIGSKGTDSASFVSANSVANPAEGYDPDENESAQLRGQLIHLLAANRISHHIKAIVREQIGEQHDEADIKEFLEKYLTSLCLRDPKAADKEDRLKKPLKAFSVEVFKVVGKAGEFEAKISITPHDRLMAFSGTIKIVPRKKDAKG